MEILGKDLIHTFVIGWKWYTGIKMTPLFPCCFVNLQFPWGGQRKRTGLKTCFCILVETLPIDALLKWFNMLLKEHSIKQTLVYTAHDLFPLKRDFTVTHSSKLLVFAARSSFLFSYEMWSIFYYSQPSRYFIFIFLVELL